MVLTKCNFLQTEGFYKYLCNKILSESTQNMFLIVSRWFGTWSTKCFDTETMSFSKYEKFNWDNVAFGGKDKWHFSKIFSSWTLSNYLYDDFFV